MAPRAITHDSGRRAFLAGLGAAAGAATLGLPATAHAAPSTAKIPEGSAPNPILAVIDTAAPPPDPPPPDPFRFIHWLLPGPPGSATPILGLPGFGLDVDPSTITDFEGFVAYAVIAGGAEDSDGNPFDCEFDVRVMDGHYRGVDGRTRRGTFGFF